MMYMSPHSQKIKCKNKMHLFIIPNPNKSYIPITGDRPHITSYPL